jgi:hypothetical protein
MSEPLDPKILGKIKKCLALSASNNPNEAATALRQAHALMTKYGVTTEGVVMSDIGEAQIKSRTMARNKPELWEANLAAIVGKAFGCSMMVHRWVPKPGAFFKTLNEGYFIFVGPNAQTQVAAYTADVLIRRCKRARAEWIKEHLGEITGLPGGKRKATRLGNDYAHGWVSKISRLVQDFAHPPEVEAAIDKYIDNSATGPSETRPVRNANPTAGRGSIAAVLAGMKAAEQERLHRPVNTAEPQQRLGY